jgi:hypothetical protein
VRGNAEVRKGVQMALTEWGSGSVQVPSDVIYDSIPKVEGVLSPDFSMVCRVVPDGAPKLVYLAGPYRPYTDEYGQAHSIAENVRHAAQLGVAIWKRGYVAVIPHTMTYLNPQEQGRRGDGGIAGVSPETFLAGEMELLSRCDMLVLMPTWRVSKGAAAEREHALKLGIPVLEWEEFVRGDA